jgi:hypothetical protein
MSFTAGRTHLRRWNLLSAGPGALTVLRSLALAGLGRRHVAILTKERPLGLADDRGEPVDIEFLQIRHAPQERSSTTPVRRHLGWRIGVDGHFVPLPKSAMRFQDSDALSTSPEVGVSNVGRLVLGYGKHVRAHANTDSFDVHPDQRLKRCTGLFSNEARLTDPVAYLRRLRRQSVYRDGRARALLARLNPSLSDWVGWDVADSLEQDGALERAWRTTPSSRRLPMLVALDMVRHAFDASTSLDHSDPLQQFGVILFDCPDHWCLPEDQPRLFTLLDGWFPRLQFFVALSQAAKRRFPGALRTGILGIPQREERPLRLPVRRLKRGAVLLVDVDGTLPNLALMKLSTHYKRQGQPVALARGVRNLPDASTVLASCVFSTEPSARRVELLRKRYGSALEVGGSGVDLRRRLAPEIEALPADFALYPELGDRAMGFLTRGCPQHCSFCVVPIKEGSPRQVSDLEAVLQGRRKLILLDDNLLAHPAALDLLEEMVRRNLEVNFNQTLDLRRLTPELAQLLRRIRCSNAIFTRRCYHFSLNDARGLNLVRQRYRLLETACTDNAEFVCMYGFNTSLAEDVERFRFLRSLPGAYVFVQRYRPPHGSPLPDLSQLFDDRAAALMDELVRIIFPQNMKSMETYYRWLCVQYAQQCRRIHYPLVETLFRYNARPRMGGFLHRLEELTRA